MKDFFNKWLHHLLWHIAVWPAMGILAYFLGSLHKAAVDSEKQNAWVIYFYEHPYRVGFAIACIYIAYKIIARLRSALIREKQYGVMLDGIGLREFSPHVKALDKTKDWDGCCKEISSSKPNSIQILGATGWDTFGSAQSPLHKLLLDFNGHIRILLLKEGQDGFKKRTNDLKRNETHYKTQIIDTLEFCKDLKTKYKKNIEVRQYCEEPIWKMILTDKYLWLQYYDPDKDVEDTPVYTLQTRNPPTLSSLYYPLTRVFEKRWGESTTKEVNLSSWNRGKSS